MTVGNNTDKNTLLNDASTLLQKLFALNLDYCAFDVFLAASQSQSSIPAYRHINLSKNMVTVFREVVQDALEHFKKGSTSGNILLQPFSVSTDDSSYEIEYLNLAEFETISQQIAPLDNYQDLAGFDQSETAFVKRLRFYTIRVQPPQGSPVYFYRKYTQAQLLSESSFFGMHWQDHLYDRISEPLFLFDRYLDCFSCGGSMYILNKNNFYTLFRFIEALEDVARQTLDALRQKDLIHNFDRFAQDCLNHKVKILKLKNISIQSYLTSITIDDLERTILNYELDIEVRRIHGKKKLVYDHSKPWHILHLLDDAYLDSRMTSASYHTKGKRGLRKK